MEKPTNSSAPFFFHTNPLLEELEKDLKSTNFPELTLKIDEYYFENASLPPGSKLIPSLRNSHTIQSSSIVHASQTSFSPHETPPPSKSVLIMSDGARSINKERRKSSTKSMIINPVASEPNLQAPQDIANNSNKTGTQVPGTEMNLNSPINHPIGRTLKPLLLSSNNSLSGFPFPSLTKETPLSPISTLKSPEGIKKNNLNLDDQENDSGIKSEPVRALPSLSPHKRTNFKGKKRKDAEAAKRLEKALERLDCEIPASVHFDLLEEVLPIVKKMYEMYASQIGEKDELTQLTLSHVEALQCRLPSAHHTHRMLFQEVIPIEGQRMHALLHPSSSINIFSKNKNEKRYNGSPSKKNNFLRMDDLLNSSGNKSDGIFML
ncbi:hypothetical protein HMI54_012887 [Coelomomyces lativittatus]|nr:hypothetical protein HMI54_012887 [Coelomomyces lativittatus]KAJ1515595.1 hypothetical protein HMI56_003307 [Coelomomyces lativittatus]KAJ1517112.1 hypothetical protein HMI55_000604 [Coelomomyces lativittatus]